MTDAQSRALRTLAQNLAVDVAVAVGAVVLPVLESGDINWRLLALSAVKTALLTVAAYVHRWVEQRA